MFKQFSLNFLKLFFPRFPSSLKGFIHFFNCSSDNFWCNSFNFCPTRSNCLVNSLLCNFNNFACSLWSNFWCNFTDLIYSVSDSICKIIAIEKPAYLTTRLLFFSSANSSSSVFASLLLNSYSDVFSSGSAVSLSLHNVLLSFLVQ